MTTNPHQSLRAFVNSVRTEIAQDDVFGQHLNRLTQRTSRVGAHGIFRRVRAVQAAVATCGGTLAEARAWTAQSLRWLQNGKAVEQKFAKYEFDTAAAAAMNDLIKFVSGMPDDLLTPFRPPSPFGSPFGQRPPGQSPFGGAPTAPSAAPPKPAFGSGAPAPAAPPAATSPFGAKPATPPKPSPFGKPPAPPASPFGKPPTRPGGLFGRPTPPPVPDLPVYIAACFDALAVTADPDAKFDPMEWLENLAKNNTTPDTPTEEKPTAALPTDLNGLYERLCVSNESTEVVELLQRIGALNDLHAIELIYKLWKGTALEDQIAIKFAIMGGDVGMAGLMTLLPVNPGYRPIFLGALTGVVKRGNLSEASRALLWQIAVAESTPEVVYCESALRLLAAIGTPEAQQILWAHVEHPDLEHRTMALHGLIECDPGARLIDLLKRYGEILPNEIPDELSVGAPFDALETVIRSARSPLALSAIRLIAYKDDPRTVPLLIEQLGRRVPDLRKAALSHLYRLKATVAADAVARLMEKDEALRVAAAEALRAWDDPRCVPVLISSVDKDNFKGAVNVIELIQKLDKFNHPAYRAWLLDGIDKLIEANDSDLEANLVGAVELLAGLNSSCLQSLLAKLVDHQSAKVQLAVIQALPKVESDWANQVLCKFIKAGGAYVRYRAAEQCKDVSLAHELLADRDEATRLLGLRLLWNAKATVILLDCLNDDSPALRDLAITALGHLHAAEAVTPLQRLLEGADRLDLWTQNAAVLAWRALAKMGVVAAPQPAAIATTPAPA